MNELLKFDLWLRKVKNIYYCDNEKMLNAYDRILANEKSKKQL